MEKITKSVYEVLAPITGKPCTKCGGDINLITLVCKECGKGIEE